MTIRIAYVDWQFETQPVSESVYADGGYVQPGAFGHGDLRVTEVGVSWVIFDEPSDNGRTRKSCVEGIVPDPNVDVDFVYYDDLWYKLRSGTGILDKKGFTSDPKTHKWGGWLPSSIAFPVKRPPFAYQLKILLDKFLGRGTSPRMYLKYLKKSNPTCFEMPEP